MTEPVPEKGRENDGNPRRKKEEKTIEKKAEEKEEKTIEKKAEEKEEKTT